MWYKYQLEQKSKKQIKDYECGEDSEHYCYHFAPQEAENGSGAAHPNNKKFTGPLENFKILLSSDSYKMLLNHIDHNIMELKTTDSAVFYEVTVLGEGKNYYKFRWIVEKYEVDGPLKDCWLTTGVSQPVSLGSSI